MFIRALKPILLCIALFVISDKAFAQSWQWIRDNTGPSVDAWPVATDPSGNIFIGGYIFGDSTPAVFGTISIPSLPALTIIQGVIAKYDPYGNVTWAYGTQNLEIINIAADQFGNLFVLGAYYGYDSLKIGSYTMDMSAFAYPSSPYVLAKINADGNVIWVRVDGQISPEVVIASGYSSFSFAAISSEGITTDATGNVYITFPFNDLTVTVGSYTFTNASVFPYSDDILLIKYDSSGSLKWAESFGGQGSDDAVSVAATPEGDVYISGGFSSGSLSFGSITIHGDSGIENAFIARFDSMGTPKWACGSTTSNIYGAFGTGIAADAYNDVYMTGAVMDTHLSFDSAEIINPDSGTSSLFLIKFDSSNNVSWNKVIYDPLGKNYAWGYTIAMSSCGDIWVSGAYGDYFSDSLPQVNIDGHLLYAPVGSYDPVFIAGYNSSGVYAGSESLASGADDQLNIACDPEGNVLLCSDYRSAVPFVVGTDTLPAIDTEEIFYLAKYKPAVPVVNSDTSYKNIDTAICAAAITLNAEYGYYSYIWNNDSTSMHIAVDTTGKYWVICTKACGTVVDIDTFTINHFVYDTIKKTVDTFFCAGSLIKLYAPSGYKNYTWSTGSADTVISTDSTGVYWVDGFTQCMSPASSDTFKSFIIDPHFSLGPDTVVCDTYTLTVPENGFSYQWPDGSTGYTYTVYSSGDYYVKITDNGCIFSDTIKITYPQLLQFLRDTILCREAFTGYPLSANVPAGATVLWSTGETTPDIIAKDAGYYWVSVTDSSCTISDTMQLSTAPCNCIAFLPTAFTPNNDGHDDFYNPVFLQGCSITAYEFSIYNRWGQRVFSSNDLAGKWDGTFNGQLADMGTYMYYLIYQSGLDNIRHTQKGDVILIR